MFISKTERGFQTSKVEQKIIFKYWVGSREEQTSVSPLIMPQGRQYKIKLLANLLWNDVYP
jgi:hypothetical protein